MIRKLTILVTVLVLTCRAHAQVEVKIPFVDEAGKSTAFEAVLQVPGGAQKSPAVIILHHAGGGGHGTTTQYASLLAGNGFVTLEPRLFNVGPDPRRRYLQEVFESLRFLAEHPAVDRNRISVMGLSYGANQTIVAATSWAHKRHGREGLQFRSHVALYPTCWRFTASIRRTLPARFRGQAPEDLADAWVGSPLLILTGTLDDYDDRDRNACQEFIDALPDPKQRSVSRVVQFEGATHGWDQVSRSFYEPVACKGRGCTNHNVHNPEVTARGQQEVLRFLSDPPADKLSSGVPPAFQIGGGRAIVRKPS